MPYIISALDDALVDTQSGKITCSGNSAMLRIEQYSGFVGG